MKQHEIVLLSDLRVDLGARRVTRDGAELSLGKLSFDLLEALLRAAPAALSNDEIVARVWSGDAVSDENIKQRVSLLRRALAAGSERDYIETLRGFGYRLADEPRPPAPAAGPADAAATPPARPRSERLARTLLLILAITSLLLLITVLAIAARQLKRSRVGTPGRASRVEEAARRPGYEAPGRKAVDGIGASGPSPRPGLIRPARPGSSGGASTSPPHGWRRRARPDARRTVPWPPARR